MVLDAPDEAELAAAAGIERALVRVTLGVDADTHEAIVTGHHGSKFGLPPEQAVAVACGRARPRNRRARPARPRRLTAAELRRTGGDDPPPRRLRRRPVAPSLGWEARVANLGGGFGIRHHPDDEVPDAAELAAAAAATARAAFRDEGLPEPAVWLEPGRCLVGRRRHALPRRLGQATRERTWVAVDGGMSDNPRPQLYDARYTALSALRADEEPDELVSVAGMHCESGDVLIDDVSLPSPQRGDLLAVPATGAYTLAMSSNYNGVTRPAAVLVRRGEAQPDPPPRDVDDLLALEVGLSRLPGDLDHVAVRIAELDAHVVGLVPLADDRDAVRREPVAERAHLVRGGQTRAEVQELRQADRLVRLPSASENPAALCRIRTPSSRGVGSGENPKYRS